MLKALAVKIKHKAYMSSRELELISDKAMLSNTAISAMHHNESKSTYMYHSIIWWFVKYSIQLMMSVFFSTSLLGEAFWICLPLFVFVLIG